MSTLTSTLSAGKGISTFIKSHPLISYFFLAYAGMWIVISPLVMDSFGWIDLIRKALPYGHLEAGITRGLPS